jgi:glycosyltransferase involved in cell wall biosynthesis
VLVGPLTLPRDAVSAPNVHLLGPRPYTALPAYVQAFDAGIIPYVENDWTRAVDPLKLLEYLAAGIPVVASPLPEVEKYRHLVRLARLGDEFVAATMEAIGGTTAEAREHGRRVAEANTWERRGERFLEILDEVLDSRAAGAEHDAGTPALSGAA